MIDFFEQVFTYATHIDKWELVGLIFGLLAVYYLIKENVLTWPAGIIYCLVSFYIFWQSKLYQDFGLTFFFLVMNIYGWYAWLNPSTNEQNLEKKLQISNVKWKTMAILTVIAIVYIIGTGYIFKRFTDANLPYWDATTTGLSLIAMWLTTRKKIENWILWLIVDILATGIYWIKGIYFYSALYFIYIVMAVLGYLNWLKLQKEQNFAA